MQWFRNVFSGGSDVRRRGDTGWFVLLGKNIFVSVPPGLPGDKKWETWGRIQVKLLTYFQKYWPDSHIYIRFNAFPPGYFEDKLKLCAHEKITTRREEVFLLPDCQYIPAMELIFSVMGMVPFTRCVYILNQKPENWKEVMERLFEATRKIAKKQPVTGYERELSMCHLLGYSSNQDLVIAKIDLPEKEIVSTFQLVAREERIELALRKKT